MFECCFGLQNFVALAVKTHCRIQRHLQNLVSKGALLISIKQEITRHGEPIPDSMHERAHPFVQCYSAAAENRISLRGVYRIKKT